MDILIPVVKIYSQDIGIEKYAMLRMNSEKRQMPEGIELPNQEKNQNTRIEGNFEILEAETIKQIEMKEKF